MNPDTTSAPSPQPDTTPNLTQTPTPAPAKPKKNNRLKLAILAAVVAVVVLGGGAAAYFGVIVPNQPDNKLKKAVENLSKQDTTTLKGSIKVTADGTSANIAINMLHVDPAQKVALADVAVTVSGITVPAEIRYVDNNLYLKLGDLSTIKSLASAYVDKAVVNQMVSKLSNQWVEIDETVLDQATSSADASSKCSSEETIAKTRAAMNDTLNLATSDNSKVYTINKVSKEDVDGEATTKLELSLDKTKLKELGTTSEDLQSVKDLEKCLNTDESTATSQEADNGEITTFNVWIDGAKHIKRFEVGMDTTSSDNQKASTTIDMTMVNDAPTVEKPSGAKPFMQLVGELQSLFYGDGGSLNALNGALSL